MLISFVILLFLGFIGGEISKKIKLPSLVGMIFVGILIGPFSFNVLSEELLVVAPDFRELALVIILVRAGLAISLDDLKQVGRPAFLLCFLPACFEILGVVIIAPSLLSISVLEALILGTVLAAVSPAVIVPRMIILMEKGYGKKHHIPQMIMAGASVDDIFVIILFTTFTSMAEGEAFSTQSLALIPVSIISGIVLGLFVGWIITWVFNKVSINTTHKTMLTLCIAVLMLFLEDVLEPFIPVSALLSIMSMGVMIYRLDSNLATMLSEKFKGLWAVAEIFLFVLVGAAVDISYAQKAGVVVVLVILFALVFRVFGVLLSTTKTNLTKNERIFSVFAYIPKATVQAAIGAIPLSMGLACGNIVLTSAVVAILVTAPLGAIAIDLSYKKLLSK